MASPYGYIYQVRNLVNGKVYIGQTIRDISSRWSGHCCDAVIRKRTFPLGSAIRKYGRSNFSVSELATATSQDELNDLELRFIKLFNSTDRTHGYNLRLGGQSGGTLSEESRRKMSEAKRGKPSPRIGMKHSPEARAKMSLWHRMNPAIGHVVSAETKMKIAAKSGIGRRGKKLTSEHKERIRQWNIQRWAVPGAREKYSALMTGHATSEATRALISSRLTGRKLTPEHIENNRLANIGRKHSEETKQKMRKPHPGSGRRRRLVGVTA